MYDTNPLEYFLPLLVKDKKVKAALYESLGDRLENAISELLEGQYDGDGGSAYDIIGDLVLNESEEVCSFEGTGSSAGEFPISVLQFGPIFWIQAPDFDDIGYFDTEEKATECVDSEWQPYMSSLGDE